MVVNSSLAMFVVFFRSIAIDLRMKPFYKLYVWHYFQSLVLPTHPSPTAGDGLWATGLSMVEANIIATCPGTLRVRRASGKAGTGLWGKQEHIWLRRHLEHIHLVPELWEKSAERLTWAGWTENIRRSTKASWWGISALSTSPERVSTDSIVTCGPVRIRTVDRVIPFMFIF